MAISFNPGDMDFICKRGYDSVSQRDDLTKIYNLDQILFNELHMSPELEEADPYYLAMLLDDNPRYAATFVDVAAGYEKLAEKGNLLAKARLGCMYRCCNYYDLRMKGMKYSEEAARSGHMQSQMVYALYTNDPNWLKKAADAGYPYAQCELGCWYYDGLNGLPKDTAKGRALWEKSNLSKGAYRRITCVEYCRSTTMDEAYLLMLSMVKTPDYYKDFNMVLGVVCEARNNMQEAYQWYKKAIDCGVYCCNRIIDLYDKGFCGQEPRAYWAARYERLQRAVARHSAYVRLTLEAVSGAGKDTSATQSVNASPVDVCSSVTSYYKTSEKKDQKGKSSWLGILVLIAAIVFAIKLIF